MGNELRFDGKVAIITGAGNGLGRAHALLFGARGAKVVVNDLGGGATGGGKSSAAADKVVDEIKALGGEAVASYDSVEDGDKIVQAAMDHFGGVDIIVNNAGILRDVSFQKMTAEDWDLIYRVHVLGAYRVTHAAWGHMRDKGYGRLIFTASAAGIYGNFGQANYSMAKLGIHGFAQSLAIEGKKKNVLVNTIAPIAGSRMTETVLPPDLVAALRPEYVSPLVAYLAHESNEETGGLFEVGGGFVGKLRWERAEGQVFKLGREISPENIRDKWGKIAGFEKSTHPTDVTSSMAPILGNLGSKSLGGNEFIDVDQALGASLPETKTRYDARDLSLYALGVGAAADPTDEAERAFVYERHGQGFRPLPTFAVIPALNAMLKSFEEGKQVPGLNYGFERVLHGEQYTELFRPLPEQAELRHTGKIKAIYDKGKGAVVITAIETFDEKGQRLALNEITTFVKGAGGWGGDRGPAAEGQKLPERTPDATIEERISPSQALLYRLSGDWNPLHADPDFAKAFGFERPILHGLCTFGYAGRHVVKAFAKGDTRLFKSIRVRFSDSVFPGETLVTEMWRDGQTVQFQCKVKERDKVVLTGGVIELHAEVPKAIPAPAPAASAGAAEKGSSAAPTAADVFVGIADFVKKNDSAKVGVVYQFKLKDPDTVWTLDLKKGAVSEGETEKPECTLELTNADFLDMCAGKADPQKLYFGGKMVIGGNLMASQKLTFLKKVDPAVVLAATQARTGGEAGAPSPTPAPAPAPAPAPSAATKTGSPAAPKELATPALLDALQKRLTENPNLAKEAGALIELRIADGGPEAIWTLDLTGPGAVTKGSAKTPTTTLTIADSDFAALSSGAESVQSLYQHGKLRVDGDIRVAARLTFLKRLSPAQSRRARRHAERRESRRERENIMGRRVNVAGVGMVKFAKPGASEEYNVMASKAAKAALADANVRYEDVEQAFAGYVYGDSTCGQRAVYDVGLTGIPVFNVNNNCSTGSSALMLGKQAIEGGLAECVLVIGFEQMEKGALAAKWTDRTNPLEQHVGVMGKAQGVNGAPFAAQMFGGAGREYRWRWGTKRETFGKIAEKARKHASKNPFALFANELTLDEIMASPEVFDPLTRYQCCPPTCGAAAAILVSDEFAKKLGLVNPVYIAGQAMTTDYRSSFDDSMIKMVGYDMTVKAAQKVYEQAGIGPSDVDVVELHDCFTANELLTYEGLGLCKEGEAEKWIWENKNTYGGDVVTNPSGGLLSKGHPLGATGLAQCTELVWQLRGQAGDRQVDNAKIALQHNLGLGGACVVTMYRRDA